LKGRNQLNAEIDLLHILKQLRTASFMSQVFMKPHQPTLIKWFAKYKISLTQAEQEEKRPDFPVLRDESVSFDPNAIENPNQNLISEDADSLDSSSDDEKIKFDNIDGPSSQPKNAELEKIKDFDPENDKIDRMILMQVITAKKKLRRKDFININSNHTSSLIEDPGPSSLLL